MCTSWVMRCSELALKWQHQRLLSCTSCEVLISTTTMRDPPWQRLRSEVGIIDEGLHHPPSPPPRLHRLHRFRHHTLSSRSPFEPVSNRCWLEIWPRCTCSPLADFPFLAHAPRPAHTPWHTPRNSKKPQWGLSNPLHVSINRHTSLTHAYNPFVITRAQPRLGHLAVQPLSAADTLGIGRRMPRRLSPRI